MAARAQILKAVPPSTSPEGRVRQKRERLAEAQAAIKRSQAKEEQARAVVDRAREQVSRARDNLGRAREAVEAARTEQQRRLVEAAKSGQAITPDTTMRELRAAELEAQDQLDAAVAALATVEASGGDPERETVAQRAQLDKMVGGVLWTQASALLEKAEALQADLIKARVELRYLLHTCKPGEASLREPADELVRAVRDFLRPTLELPGTYGSVSYGVDWDHHPATNPWRKAREALAKDAEAELPEG